MRMIGKIEDDAQARRFGDFLFAQGIENDIEPSADGSVVWVHEEDDFEQARALFEDFRQAPDDQKFVTASTTAHEIRTQQRREERKSRTKNVDMRTAWHRQQSEFNVPVTGFLVLASIAVAVLSGLGRDRSILNYLFITLTDVRTVSVNGQLMQVAVHGGWGPIFHGQIWRLVTPIFIHFGFIHIFFNMMWTLDLGRIIESRRGSLYFALLVIGIAIPSNVCQFVADGASFGGMSGVIFGLVGYMWVRNRYEYGTAYPMHSNIMTLMMIWFVVCMLGIVGNVANWAHGVGLVSGALWGLIVSRGWRQWIR